MQNFRQIAAQVEIESLLREIEAAPSLWNEFNLRTTHPGTVHGAASDIWIRFNDVTKYKPENLYQITEDLDCKYYPPHVYLPRTMEITRGLMNLLNVENLGRVIITKLPVGQCIDPHIDEGAYARFYKRYHVTLKNEAGSIFRCGDEVIEPKAGDIYWFDTSKKHEVINNSTADRITLIIDAI